MDTHLDMLPLDPSLRQRAKAQIRERMRTLRQAMPASSCAMRSRCIVERLSASPLLLNARSVGLFFPIEEHHEVDLRPLDLVLRQHQVRVAYPRASLRTSPETFCFVDSYDHMHKRQGWFQPPDDTTRVPPQGLDVIFVPAVALDLRGYRVGYGGGYYDRILLDFLPAARVVGIAYDYQLVVEVPETLGDVPVHWIVTDKRTLPADNAREECHSAERDREGYSSRLASRS